MAATVRDVMTPNPVCLEPGATLMDAARTMAERDIGDVLVAEGTDLLGIVTDRDLVVRAVAAGLDARTTRLGEIISRSVVTIQPDEPVSRAAELMRENASRRLPVVEGHRPVGIVSLGDLARERDHDSVLADISEAPANN
jgi:CBS domain-containing protein